MYFISDSYNVPVFALGRLLFLFSLTNTIRMQYLSPVRTQRQSGMHFQLPCRDLLIDLESIEHFIATQRSQAVL